MSLFYLVQIGGLIGFLLLVLVLYITYKASKKFEIEESKREVLAAKPGKKSGRNSKLYVIYEHASKFKLTRKFLARLVSIYSARIPGDYRTAREEATKSAVIIWASSFALIAYALVTGASTYGLSCAFLASYFLSRTIVSSKMEQYDLQIITELNQFLDDVRHHYFATEMVPEAIRLAKEKTKLNLIKQHAQKIYDVVTSDDISEAVKRYNAAAGNYFLKKFTANAVTVEKYGDKVVDDELLFLSSLRDLKQDIQIELMDGRARRSAFSFLGPISCSPYFFLGAMEEFGKSSFASLIDIYNGTYGSVIKVLLFFYTIFAYTFVGVLKDSTRVEEDRSDWLQWIYSLRPIKKIVNSKLNRNWGKALKLRSLLKKTGNTLNMYQFTTKRLVYFVVGFIGAIIFLAGMHVRNKSMYANNVINVAQTSSGASDTECFEMTLLAQHYLKTYVKFDARKAYNQASGKPATMTFDGAVEDFMTKIIKADLHTKDVQFSEQFAYSYIPDFLEEFSGSKLAIINLKDLTYEEAISSQDQMVKSGLSTLRKMMAQAGKADCFHKNTALSDTVAKKVAAQLRKVQNQYFKWYDVIWSFMFGVLFYFEPYAFILVRKKALQMDMMDEIVQFESVILILMHMERMTVEEILDWMCMFARIFKPSLQKCIAHYPLDNDDALDNLIADEPFEPFGRLIEDLKACDKVGVKHAFNGLECERKNYQETRKQENELSINSRGSLGNALAFGSFSVVVVMYLVVPIMMAAVGDLSGALSAIMQQLV